MRSQASASLSVARMLASWLSFTRWTFSACVDRMQDLADEGADRVKDTMMDLGCEPPGEGQLIHADLPPLAQHRLAFELAEEIQRTLARTVELVNESPTGSLSPHTEEQVRALFAELGQTALATALDVRIADAVALAEQSCPDGWVRKYRHMLAEEGRWPPAPSE
jgi:hypothetical protein